MRWGVAVVEARAMGKRCPAVPYRVGGEGIRRYARVVGLDLSFADGGPQGGVRLGARTYPA